MKLIEYLDRQPKILIVVIAPILVLIIGTVDYFVTIEISLSIFYLLPVSLATWSISREYGFSISILSAISWLIGSFHVSYPVEYEWLYYWNAGVRLLFFIIVSNLLGIIKVAYDKEKYYARMDSLTQVFNRRFFLELLERELQRYSRYRHPFTLAYFDLDNFKTVNDTFGHSTGDRLLCLITKTIQTHIRATDIIARLGGDEFALLLPETDYEGGQKTLNRLQQQLLAVIRDENFAVTMSIGAVTFRKLPKSLDVMLEKADKLMYEVKNDGKNNLRHEIFD